MKKLLGIFLLLASITSCSTYKENAISIEQNGRLISPSNGVVVLEKEEFDIILNLPKPMAVLVNTSFNDKLYSLSSKGEQMFSRKEFSESHAMAIALFNPEKRIYISDDASNPWYYENEQEHNFNKVEISKGKFICTRSIKNIWDPAIEGSYDIRNIDQAIYLVFVPTISGENPTGEMKMDTKHLKIEWK